MKANDPTPRVLIVENEETTIENLTYKLQRDLPSVKIVTAETSQDARVQLARALAEGTPFDVAILDLRLPHDCEDPGEAPDYQLASLFPANDGLTVHMTAKADDFWFSRARPDPDSPDAKRRLYVEKIDTANEPWAQKVVDAAVAFIRGKHSRRIGAEFERLFGHREKPERNSLLSTRSSTGVCDRERGVEIAAFCDDAGEHWDCLDEPLRRKLDATLGHVRDEVEGRDYVGVLTNPAPSPDSADPTSAKRGETP